MSKTIEIDRDLLADMLALAGGAKSFVPLAHEARDLITRIEKALADDSSPASGTSIAVELLEAISRTTGVHLPTVASLHALRQACEALATMGVTDGKVIKLPRSVDAGTRTAIAAEVSRQIEETAGVDVLFFVSSKRQPIASQRLLAKPCVGDHVLIDRMDDGRCNIDARVTGVWHGYDACALRVYVAIDDRV